MEKINDFDGVFRFTNPTKRDFIVLWNNKEYTFPAEKTVPIVISDETLENIQEIRKRFAYKLALREFYDNGEWYKKHVKMGNGLPPTFDEKFLEPMIQECLKPLPIASVIVTKKQTESDKKFRASKAVDSKGNLNEIFKDSEIDTLGEMPNSNI